MSVPVFWMFDPEADAIKSPFVRQPHYNDLENRIRELESQEKVATDFIVRVLEAIDIDVPKPCDVIISLETVWYQVLGHIEGLKGELTDKDARIHELEAIIARNDTTESFKCSECGAWHVRKVDGEVK